MIGYGVVVGHVLGLGVLHASVCGVVVFWNKLTDLNQFTKQTLLPLRPRNERL